MRNFKVVVLLPVYLAVAMATVLLLTKLGVSIWVSIPLVAIACIVIIYATIVVRNRKNGK